MGRQENVFVDGMEKHRPGCYRGGFQGNEIARVSVTDVRQQRKDRLPGAECEAKAVAASGGGGGADARDGGGTLDCQVYLVV